MTFQSLGLSAEILKAVEEAGYTQPTPIQEKAIPFVLKGRDVLGIAQTGTGKTASFTLPMIDLLAKGRAKARMPRSLILAPTRELAAQVSENFEQYGKYHKLTMALLIGGVSFADQERKLDRGVDVLIATPGRLLDHFERGKLMLNGVQILVIDEADRMLDMGFIPDIERICKLLPFARQTLFFSATMPPEIQRLTELFLHNPERVEAAPPATAAATVHQAKVIVDKDDKRKALRRLIRENNVKNAIIFCNRKRDVSVLYRSLTKHDFSAGAIHGDLDQHVRMKVLDGFRRGEIRLLVASDVAARGLDIPDVSHIFNFDVPINAEDYIHRIGRTGRAGKEGHAFTIATRQEKRYLDAIEKLLGEAIPSITVKGLGERAPEGDDAGEADESGRRKRGGRGRRKEGAEAGAREKGRGGEEKPSGATEKSDRKAAKKGEKKGERKDEHRRPRREERDEPVVGLGDHVPAFLLKPVRLAKPAEAEAAADGGGNGENSKLEMAS